MRSLKSLLRFVLATFILTEIVSSARAVQTLAPAGTVMNVPHNYSWSLMTTINVYGASVPFAAYSFNNFGGSAGSYTFTMNTTGFPGAINLYQNFFDPFQPTANFYVNGKAATTAGTVSLTTSIPANSLFTVVFSGATNGSSGTYSATMTGPANVTITTNLTVGIVTAPKDQTLAAGQNAILHVYATGPLPHTWQWYGGASPSTANPAPGATNANYFPGPFIVNSTSFWVKVTGPAGAGSANSGTATITITGNTNANYNGSLAAGGCVLPNGKLFNVQRFQIQTAGNYAFAITPGFTLDTYEGVFDSAHTNANYWGPVNGFYAVGTYDLVISKASPGGAYNGAIGGGPAIVTLPASLPPQFLSSPQDTTVLPNHSATLVSSETCGTPFTLQWYRGHTGDTNLPIAGATGPTYTTPLLATNTVYWVRMNFASGTSDSGEAVVYVTTGPISDTGVLTLCDHKFVRPASAGVSSGSNCFYKEFVFTTALSGTNTFTLTSSTGTAMYLYQGIFDPANPLVNLYAVGAGSTLTSYLLSSPQPYYLVISGFTPNSVGTYAVTNTVSPGLITRRPAPTITTQPASTNIFFNQTATLSVVSSNSNISYQWYAGSDCATKVAIAGANSNVYTTPPLTNYDNYYVELTTPGGYLFSALTPVGIQPKAVDDPLTATLEDTLRLVGAPGVLKNDTKAAKKTLTAINYTQPAHGTVKGTNDGSFSYLAATNYFGPDSFTYQATDGTLTSAVATVVVTVTPVADTPSVTGATTLQGVQTTSGLVISRNPVDGAEVTYFKIGSITNGLLFLNDGITPVTNGAFITFAAGNAGLKFTPSAGLNSSNNTFGFALKAAVGATDADVGGAAVAAVVNVYVAPSVSCSADIITNSQPGSCVRNLALAVTASGGYPAPVVTYTLNNLAMFSPYPFSPGTNIITVTASNGVAANATCSYTVIVRDTELPQIFCVSDIITNSGGNCPVVVNYNPGASDNCSLSSVAINPPSGSSFNVGTNTVTVTAIDAANNTNTCAFHVIVQGGLAPTLNLNLDTTNSAVLLSWSSNSPCYTLEFSPTVEVPYSNTVWTPIEGPYGTDKQGNPVVTNALKLNLFYRLSY